MPIPKHDAMYRPFLEAIQDGHKHSMKEVKNFVAEKMNISESDKQEMLRSGLQRIYDNRIGWTRTYLKKAGLIESPERATFVITSIGRKCLADNEIIDNKCLLQFESFKKFYLSDGEEKILQVDAETPDDLFDKTFSQINAKLIEDILGEISKMPCYSFERMVIDLLMKMGYGGSFEHSGETTQKSCDEGIDGIIKEDKLGFNLIYIQAKLWELSRTVGRPEIQSFVGAISGKGGKGLFVTTAKFSKPAIEYAESQHVILIDGESLAKLMIENNFGVSVRKTFEIKDIDTDKFDEYLD